ncbi:MAG: PEP-utilizing enzyme, partial [Halobacteriota archaeon]
NPDDIYARCSVEELLPGVMTPLTASTTLRALDLGIQRMYSDIATLKTFREQPWIYVYQCGYPFFNMSVVGGIGRTTISGDEKDAAEMACGEPVPGIIPGPLAPLSERLRNGLRFFNPLLLVNHVKKLQKLVVSIDLAPRRDAREMYAVIDRELPKLAEAHYRHNSSSMLGAFAIGVLPRLLSKGAPPTAQHSAETSRLLSGAKDVENYDIVSGVKRIVSALVQHDGPQLDRFVGLDAQAADRFLRHEASASVQRAYTTHLERHGHRCIRELDMYAKDWAEDPTPVVKAVQSGLQAVRAGGAPVQKDKQISVPLTLAPVVRLGWRGIRNRETTKSQLVLATALFRRAYRTLARQMVEEGLLPNEDLAFFLQHAELAELLSNRDERLIETAIKRRAVLPYQEKLVFKRYYHGAIESIDPQRPSEEGILYGKPASVGIARGRARVVRTLDAVGDVQPGEILIAPVVDVGWTPTYATIAGFASDVGSAIAHGAVVAREFDIPLVINLKNATETFRTGDLVELDAYHGVLRRIPED